MAPPMRRGDSNPRPRENPRRTPPVRGTSTTVLFLMFLGVLAWLLLSHSPLLPILRGLWAGALGSGSTPALAPVGYEAVNTSAPVRVPQDWGAQDPYSSTSPGAIAFLFMSQGLLPLAPLWERFFKGHEHRYSVFVHFSASSSWRVQDNNSPSMLSFIGRQVPSAKVVWGDISMVDAERRLLQAALMDPLNLYFVLVSESCIPLWPFPYVFNYLATSPVSFVEVFLCPLGIGYGRYNDAMGPEITRENFRKGSQWFALQHNHALMVTSDTVFYPKFRKYCRVGEEYRNCYSDEHYIQTLLSIKDPAGLANYSVTFVDWSTRFWHPTTFNEHNVTVEALRTIKNEMRFIRWRSYWFRVRRKGFSMVIDNNSDRPLEVPKRGLCKVGDEIRRCSLFARKFDPSTLTFLLENSLEELGY